MPHPEIVQKVLPLLLQAVDEADDKGMDWLDLFNRLVREERERSVDKHIDG